MAAPAVENIITQFKSGKLVKADASKAVKELEKELSQKLGPFTKNGFKLSPAQKRNIIKSAEKQAFENLSKKARKAFQDGKIGLVNTAVSQSTLVSKGGHKLVDSSKNIITSSAVAEMGKSTFPTIKFRDFLARPDIENNIDHMYLDKANNVTVGIGLKLPNAAAAQALNFFKVDLKTGKPLFDKNGAVVKPTQADIKAAYDAIVQKSAAPNENKLAASAFKGINNLRLSDADIKLLAITDIDKAESIAKRTFSAFEYFPVEAQMGIVDVIYNVGNRGFKLFTKMIAAIECRDWIGAGIENHPNNPGAKGVRNDARASIVEKDFFAVAATKQKFFFLCRNNKPTPTAPVLPWLTGIGK